MAVTFEKSKTLTLTFTEKGLASGQLWSVELNGYAATSTGTTLVFRDLSPGTYSYAVVEPLVGQAITGKVGSVAVGSAGSLTLTGSARVHLVLSYPYAATFTDQGMTGGNWSATIHGVVETAPAGDSIIFELGNGTYAYRVGGVGDHKAVGLPGKVTVDGILVTVVVTFTGMKGSGSSGVLAALSQAEKGASGGLGNLNGSLEAGLLGLAVVGLMGVALAVGETRCGTATKQLSAGRNARK